MNALETITVDAPCGPITGRRKEGSYLFAGVPYAEAPIDALRFRAPVKKARFDAPFSALKFSPAAPQVATGGMTDSATVRWSEDCLALNVSTPGCDAGGRAVLVWIHGGAYRTGQSSIPWYAGGSFNKNGDIVVVSINYRLGALGFTDLSHLGEDFADSAVNGLKDQILALEWVRDNIAAFGGDPNRVTIAGESAGGFSVSTLVGCEAAQGLFARAIPQSGGAHNTLPKAASAEVSRHFLDVLGQDDVMGLEAASVEDILSAQTETVAHFEGGMRQVELLGTSVSVFYPAHGTPLLPVSPLEAIGAGTGSSVAMMTGSNTDETTLWGYGKVDDERLVHIATRLGAGHLVAEYRALHPDATAEDVLIAMTSDHMFRIPAIRMAEARAPHTEDTWLYLFNWASRAFNGRLKATHALEIPFAFDNLNKAGVDAFLGPGDRPQHVADVMHRAWIDFINDGDPGWPRYDDRRITMVFDDASQATEDPAGAARALWAGVR